MDEKTAILMDFFCRIESDCRISTAHISLYTCLWRRWKELLPGNQLVFFSREIMPVCKIASVSTFHKTIRQLREYGYISYAPSFNHFCGSMVGFIVPVNNKSLVTTAGPHCPTGVIQFTSFNRDKPSQSPR